MKWTSLKSSRHPSPSDRSDFSRQNRVHPYRLERALLAMRRSKFFDLNGDEEETGNSSIAPAPVGSQYVPDRLPILSMENEDDFIECNEGDVEMSGSDQETSQRVLVNLKRKDQSRSETGQASRSAITGPPYAEDEEPDEVGEGENDRYESDYSESTLVDKLEVERQPSPMVDDTLLIEHDKFPVSDYSSNNRSFVIDFNVHAKRTVQLKDGDFLRVNSVLEQPHTDPRRSQFLLKGWRFKSYSRSNAMLSETKQGYGAQQVYMDLLIDVADRRTDLEQGQVTVSVEEAVGNVDLVITNATSTVSKPWSLINGQLVCTWIARIKVANERIHGAIKRLLSEQSMNWVTENEADSKYRVSDCALTVAWRDELPKLKHQYTFGDAFCGAGGTSVAARLAGIDVILAFDMDKLAIDTYGANFRGPNTVIYQTSAEHMIAILRVSHHYVDILHVSAPCGPYSPANTKPNLEKNAANHATLLAISDLIRLVRPRVVTLEQTSGIVTHHREWFNKVINMITDQCYSVRWKIIHFNDYGYVHDRRRVIIFGSCPGGVLPPFPVPTHNKAGSVGLQKHTTIKQALAPLRGIRPGTLPHHNPHTPRGWRQRPGREPYDEDTPLQNVITTHGTADCHPSGLRNFTAQELAMLMGLPITFVLPESQSATALRKQIGNMVPGKPFAPFLRVIAEALEQEDMERNDLQQTGP